MMITNCLSFSSARAHKMVALTGKMFHKYDNEAIVKRLFTNRPRNDWNGGYMKTIISVILTVVSASVLADSSIKTSQIERWGYAEDRLVLFAQNGKTLKVTPKLCSLAAFNERLSSGAQINIDIPARQIRQNAPFYVVGTTENGATTMKCRMARVDV